MGVLPKQLNVLGTLLKLDIYMPVNDPIRKLLGNIGSFIWFLVFVTALL